MSGQYIDFRNAYISVPNDHPWMKYGKDVFIQMLQRQLMGQATDDAALAFEAFARTDDDSDLPKLISVERLESEKKVEKNPDHCDCYCDHDSDYAHCYDSFYD